MNACIKTAYIRSTLITIALAAASLPAVAEENRVPGQYFIQARAGTLGAGVGAGYRFNEYFVLRGWLDSGGSESGARRVDENRYDLNRKTRHSSELLIDWYAFGSSGYRLSAGVVAADTRSKLSARPNRDGDYVLNGNNYSSQAVGDMTVRVRPQHASPYLGLGWESQGLGNQRLRLFVDAGVQHLQSRSAAISFGTKPDDERFLRDITAEQQRIKDVNDVSFRFSAGVSYSF